MLLRAHRDDASARQSGEERRSPRPGRRNHRLGGHADGAAEGWLRGGVDVRGRQHLDAEGRPRENAKGAEALRVAAAYELRLKDYTDIALSADDADDAEYAGLTSVVRFITRSRPVLHPSILSKLRNLRNPCNLRI